MTEASYSLLETVSRDVTMFRDDPDSQLLSFPDGDDGYDPHSDQDQSASAPSYAPANWLDAFCRFQLTSIGSSEIDTSELIVIADTPPPGGTSEITATPVANCPISWRKARVSAGISGAEAGTRVSGDQGKGARWG